MCSFTTSYILFQRILFVVVVVVVVVVVDFFFFFFFFIDLFIPFKKKFFL